MTRCVIVLLRAVPAHIQCIGRASDRDTAETQPRPSRALTAAAVPAAVFVLFDFFAAGSATSDLPSEAAWSADRLERPAICYESAMNRPHDFKNRKAMKSSSIAGRLTAPSGSAAWMRWPMT